MGITVQRTAIIAGGSGLIGREIVKVLKKATIETLNLDITNDADIPIFLNRFILPSAIFRDRTINVWVNTTYPQHWSAHLDSFLYGSLMAANHMKENSGGVIINISSIYGLVGSNPSLYQNTSVAMTPIEYSMVKGAIISLTKAIATRYAYHNVRACWICPGGIYNEQDPEFVRRYCMNVPLQKMVDPKSIAQAVLFLINNEDMTGTGIVVDGGFTAW